MMCWLFLTDVIAFFGRPMERYRNRKLFSKKTHTHWGSPCKSRWINTLLSDHFSLAVWNILQSGLRSQYPHRGLPKKAITSVKKSQHIARYFSKLGLWLLQKYLYVLTFFDRFLFHIWCTYGAISGQKDSFGLDPHPLRKYRLGLPFSTQNGNPKW